ncbi:hypothetical protein EON82_21200 [bacterium]|nr:MAG: hypothetical protein EON82_21200 [bacterium]
MDFFTWAILGVAGIWGLVFLLQWAINVTHAKQGEASLSRLTGSTGFDRKAALARGEGAIAIDTSSNTIAVLTPSGRRMEFPSDKVLDVSVDANVKTTHTTRGSNSGLAIGGVMVGSSNAKTTSHSELVEAYLILSLDDFDTPSLELPFLTLSEAQHWCGLIKTLKHRASKTQSL